jgi:DNA-binding transcriptional MerR regulator/methylmalonyl-CoA mutase cobalamin-binding subunit
MPPSYPIGAAAKLTGIPLDTLRAWERRYKAVVPKRVGRGRLYSEVQIQRLLLLRQVVEQGHAIGQVAPLTDRRLQELLQHSSSVSKTFPARQKAGKDQSSIELLLPVFHALDRFDYAATDREINRLAATMASPRDFVHQAALPLMRTIGQRWHDGKCSIAQEHMLTNLLSALLASLVRTYSPSNPPARVLLATPRDDRHSFPTLVAAMLTAVAGLGVIYLGADLPSADIILAARKSEADAVLLSLSTAPAPETLEEFAAIARKIPRSKALWLGGAPELNLDKSMAGSRWLVLHDFPAFEHQLTALGGRF